MITRSRWTLGPLVAALFLALAGCEEESPAGDTGTQSGQSTEQMGEMKDRAGKALGEVMEQTDEKAQDAGKALEEAGESQQETGP